MYAGSTSILCGQDSTRPRGPTGSRTALYANPDPSPKGPGRDARERARSGLPSGLGFRLLNGMAAFVVVVLIVLPLLALLLQSVWPNLFSLAPNLVISWAGFRALFQDPYGMRSVVDSAVLAGGTAVIATLLGGVVAYLLEAVELPGRGFFTGMTWLVLLSPSFLIGQGWQFLFAPGGIWATGWLSGVLMSPVGVAIVLSFKLFPFATLAISGALRGIGQDVGYAARISGASRWVAWRRILAPLLLPAALAGALIVFAEVLSDFGVASTLAQSANFPLMTYAIYAVMETFPVNFPEAAALSVMLVAIVSSAQWVERWIMGRRGYATRWGGSQTLGRQPLTRPWVWVGAISALFVVAFVLPSWGIFAVSFQPSGAVAAASHHWTLANYQGIWSGTYGISTFVRSLGYAVVAGGVGLAAGVLVSVAWWRRGGWLVATLKALTTTTIAIPGIVLGAGYIFFWNQPMLSKVGLSLYGTPTALLLAYVAGTLPYSVRVASGSMVQIPPNAIFAARTAGAGLTRVILKIFVPLLRDTWFRVWLISFAGVIFELPVSQLLYPAGAPTLAVGIVHQIHSLRLGVGAALTVTSTLMLGVMIALAQWIQGRWSRQRARAGNITMKIALDGSKPVDRRQAPGEEGEFSL